MKRVVIATIAMSLFAGAGNAQSNELIEADRPGIAESGSIVGRGTFQLEAAVQSEHGDEGGVTARLNTVPTLLRYGLTDKLELRLESDLYSRGTAELMGEKIHASGLAPLEVGAKLQFLENESAPLQTLALLGTVTIPSGTDEFEQEDASGELRLVSDIELSEKWAINPNVGIALHHDEEGELRSTATASAELEYSVSDRLKPFIELAKDAPDEGEDDSPWIIDGGVAWIVRADTQLDLALGRAVANGDTPDFFWTAGVSHRF